MVIGLHAELGRGITMSSVFELGGKAVNKNTAMAMSGGTNFKPKIHPSAVISDLPEFEIVDNPTFSNPLHNKTGLVFNRLKVIGLKKDASKNNGSRWVCKCICGNYTVLRSYRLTDENLENCMCAECVSTNRLKVKAKNKYT